MNKNSRKMTTRERRERYRRSLSLTHLLIAVVALIECLLLVTFTTYSWIESSSSLVISSEENNIQIPMSIAHNLAYQVNFIGNHAVSLGGTSVPDSDGSHIEDAYYSRVLHFNYAKTSSLNGKDFFFPYTNGSGSGYRAGETTDYNTAYNYIDFEIKNTGAAKNIYFRNDQVFSYISGGASENDTLKQKILDAMRISLQYDDEAPVIYSNKGVATTPVNATNFNASASNNASVTPRAISGYTFPHDGDTNTTMPVFECPAAEDEDHPVTAKVSIRIWFEMRDPDYLRDKDNIDAVLSGSQIGIDFTLLYSNVFYDTVYFDDYAFSVLDEFRGQHVTDEAATNGYSLYFHVYDNSTGTSADYPMTAGETTPEGAKRWSAYLPVLTTFNYLTAANDTSGNNLANSYFYYGSSSGRRIAYKWNMSDIGYFTTVTTGEDEDAITELSESTQVIRNLGVVNSGSVRTLFNTGGTITGFAQYDTGNDAMTLVKLNDRATGYTGGSYNQTYNGYAPYQYITSSAGSIKYWGASAVNDSYYHGLYYIDLPKRNGTATLSTIIFNNGYWDSSNQTKDINVSSIWNTTLDGTCYVPNGQDSGDNWKVTMTTMSTTGLPVSTSGDPDKARVYFYNNIQDGHYHTDTWDGVKLYAVYSNGSTNTPSSECGAEMYQIEDNCDYTQNYDDLYVNRVSTTSGGSTQAATAKQTIQPYYAIDSQHPENNCFKAYVPASWLSTAGTYLHYNSGHFYNDASDRLRFDLGVAATTNTGTNEAPVSEYIYTMLGYTNATAINSLSGGTGVGTWSATREIRFATELIDTEIFAANVYSLSAKLDGSSFTGYALAPVDSLGLTFKAYLPTSCAEAGKSRFTRSASLATAGTITGYWYPNDDIGDDDETYYAVPADASTDSSSAVRGYFHLAVLNDATFENLIYDIIHDDDRPASSTLEYSYNGDTYYYLTYVDSGSAADANNSNSTPYLVPNSTRRWIIPIVQDNVSSVYYRWTPYSGTVFTYTHDLSDGIYFNIAEGYSQ